MVHDGQDTKSEKPGSGVVGAWLIALVWNAIAFPVAWPSFSAVFVRREWIHVADLVFPAVGLFLLWVAIRATLNQVHGAGASTIKAAPRRPASFGDASAGKREALAPDVHIPAHVAGIDEHDHGVTIVYPGGYLSAFIGNLIVAAGDGQLKTSRAGGVFGGKEVRVAQSTITGIVPVYRHKQQLSEGLMRYYNVDATTRDGGRITVALNLPGEEIADWLAGRIARALKVAPDRVGRASKDIIA